MCPLGLARRRWLSFNLKNVVPRTGSQIFQNQRMVIENHPKRLDDVPVVKTYHFSTTIHSQFGQGPGLGLDRCPWAVHCLCLCPLSVRSGKTGIWFSRSWIWFTNSKIRKLISPLKFGILQLWTTGFLTNHFRMGVGCFLGGGACWCYPLSELVIGDDKRHAFGKPGWTLLSCPFVVHQYFTLRKEDWSTFYILTTRVI